MRARIVALQCGPNRSVVGTFLPAADGELMLEKCASFPAGDSGECWATVAQDAGRGARVVVVPPANLTLTRFPQVPRLARVQREKILRFEAAQAIPLPLEQVVWDWTPAGDSETTVELCAMRVAAAEECCAAAARAGVRLEAIVARAAALRRALAARGRPSDGPAVLAEVDGDLALVIRGAGGPPAVRLVGLPAAATAHDTPTGDGDHENLRWRRLAVEMTRLFAGDPEAAQPAAARTYLLAGTDAPSPGEIGRLLPAEASRVELFNAFEGMRLSPGGAGVAAHELAALVGAARMAVAGGAPNLLPDPRRRENRFRRRRRWCLAGAAALAVLTWGGALALAWQGARSKAEAASLERALEPWRLAAREVAARQREIDACTRELAVIDGMGRKGTAWPDFLADAESRLARTGDAWLDTLQVLAPMPGPSSRGAGGLSGDGVVRTRLSVSGRLLDPGQDGRRGLERIRGLLRGWPEGGVVEAVEDERFDANEPGVLRFACVLVLEPEAGL